jgi:hypothetical protein
MFKNIIKAIEVILRWIKRFFTSHYVLAKEIISDHRDYAEQMTVFIDSGISHIGLFIRVIHVKRYRPLLQAADVLESRDSMRMRMVMRTVRYALFYLGFGINKASRNEARLTPYLFLITHLRKLNVFFSAQTRLFSYFSEHNKFNDNEQLSSFPFVDKKLRKAQFNVLLGQVVNKKNKFHNTLFSQEDICNNKHLVIHLYLMVGNSIIDQKDKVEETFK